MQKTKITAPAKYSGPASYGDLVLEFRDGVAETPGELNDGHRRYFRRRGFTVEEVAAYDPAAHNVTEVIEYLDSATDEERERVLAAEQAGEARKGVLAYSTPKETPEETPETPDETGEDGDA